jgi:hypothetical protein
MAWRLPDGYRPIGAPMIAADCRPSEILVVRRRPPSRWGEHLVETVRAAGYDELPPERDWLHFRPRSSWWHGIGRHARLRSQSLHVRLEADRTAARGLLVGLVLPHLEPSLARLGAMYVPRG